MRFGHIFLFVTLFYCTITAADTKFYSINSIYGISLRETSSLSSDKNGFIWASAKTGILRLTENDCRLYKLPYDIAFISSRLLYSNNVLYVCANDGQMFYYNSVKDKFVPFVNLSKLLSDKFLVVNDIQADDKGAFWIATRFGGLYRYYKQKISLIGKQRVEIRGLAWYDKRHLIVGYLDNVSLLDTETGTNKPLAKLGNPNVLAKLYFDKAQNKLWIGTVSSGLYEYDFKKRALSQFNANAFPHQPVLAITANSDSTLLIGVDGQGIWKIDRKKADRILDIYKEDSDNAFSLHGDGVYDIFCDRNNRVWTATYSGGISFFDQTPSLITQVSHSVNNANSLCNNFINKIIEDSRGNIWFATNNGISKWDIRSSRWATFYHNERKQAQVFLALCEDNKGNIWAGTYASGVYVLDGTSGREIAHYGQNTGKSPFVNNFIHDIYKDSDGDLWIGGSGGNIACYIVKENRFRIYQEQPVSAFVEYKRGTLLLACSYGLCSLDKKTGVETILKQGFLAQGMTISNGEAWVATRGDGLIRFNLTTKKIVKITTTSGLPSNFINGIMKIGDCFWIGTESGLCKFNPKNYSATTYSSHLSLSRASYNINAQCQLRNGSLIWGTNNGAVMFSPAAIRNVASRASLYLQDLNISGISIKDNPEFKLKCPLDSLTEIKLNYSQNTFSLELLALGQNTSDSKYSYQLEGFDKTWSQPNSQKIITYTNLPSGRYVLKIRLYDNSMDHIITERSINIRIVPPVWARWWFVILMLLIVIGVIYILSKYYIEHIKKLHVEEKVQFFANTAHEIRTTLTLIKAPIEELNKDVTISEAGKYYLRLASEQSKRLSRVVTQIMDFQKLDVGKEHLLLCDVDIVNMIQLQKMMFESYAQSKNIELIFNTNVPAYNSGVDEIMMEKVLGNLISNAIKYSHPKSRVTLNLYCTPEDWTLDVIDQGIGMSENAQQGLFNEFYRGDNAINAKVIGSGIGLMIAKNYVLLHGGEISCSSQENVGSCFKIIIPYKDVATECQVMKMTSNQQDTDFSIESPDLPILDQVSDDRFKKMKLLIVEDNDDLRNFLLFTLGIEFEVHAVENGQVAWEMVQKDIPDMVVSDIMMPVMDGFELCSLIKSTFQTSHVPVILLTALSEQVDQLHGLGLGADDYLTKPFDVPILLQRIKSIVQNRIHVREKALRMIDDDGGEEQIFENKNNDQFVKKALSVVRANLEKTEFGKDEFASAMNVSASLLYKKLKTLTDQSPNEFIKCIRLNYAIELLKSRKYSITEVSELTGFASAGYFSTVFKKYFGKSPTDILDA
jgi:signal transduction histidine kinase/DNA-binding response OmpR family regulator/ligand-binding sensor domain-containing protein